MTRAQRSKYEMLIRVRDFGAGNKELFPEASVSGKRFAMLAANLATLDGHMANRVVARAEATKVRTQTRTALFDYIKRVAMTARQVTLNDSEVNPFRVPRSRSSSAVIATARAFITEAEKRQEEFVNLGMPATFISELRALVDKLDKAVTTQLNSHSERRQAQVGIKETLEDGFDAVREIDVHVSNVLRLDPVRFAAYQGARRVLGLSNAVPQPAVQTSETLPKAS